MEVTTEAEDRDKLRETHQLADTTFRVSTSQLASYS